MLVTNVKSNKQRLLKHTGPGLIITVSLQGRDSRSFSNITYNYAGLTLTTEWIWCGLRKESQINKFTVVDSQ